MLDVSRQVGLPTQIKYQIPCGRIAVVRHYTNHARIVDDVAGVFEDAVDLQHGATSRAGRVVVDPIAEVCYNVRRGKGSSHSRAEDPVAILFTVIDPLGCTIVLHDRQ